MNLERTHIEYVLLNIFDEITGTVGSLREAFWSINALLDLVEAMRNKAANDKDLEDIASDLDLLHNIIHDRFIAAQAIQAVAR